MKRTTIAALTLVAATAIAPAAPAQQQLLPNGVGTAWVQPGEGPLDGVGVYLYLAPQPTPGASQLSPPTYSYDLNFTFEHHGALHSLSLRTDGVNVAVFKTGGDPMRMPSIAYPWTTGRLYFLMVHRVADGLWGAWVLDVWANQWTLIGQNQVPVEWGGLAPFDATAVNWTNRAWVAPCESYPRTDAFFTPPIGIRNGTFTLATLTRGWQYPEGCPSEISSFEGWTHYGLGTRPR